MIFRNCFFLRNGGVGANYNNPFFPIINLGGPPVGHVMDRHFKPSFLWSSKYAKCASTSTKLVNQLYMGHFP